MTVFAQKKYHPKLLIAKGFEPQNFQCSARNGVGLGEIQRGCKGLMEKQGNIGRLLSEETNIEVTMAKVL